MWRKCFFDIIHLNPAWQVSALPEQTIYEHLHWTHNYNNNNSFIWKPWVCCKVLRGLTGRVRKWLSSILCRVIPPDFITSLFYTNLGMFSIISFKLFIMGPPTVSYYEIRSVTKLVGFLHNFTRSSPNIHFKTKYLCHIFFHKMLPVNICICSFPKTSSAFHLYALLTVTTLH